MTYDEAMERFGHDAPDLRFGLELVDCTDLAAEVRVPRVPRPCRSGGRVRGLNAKGAAAEFSRKRMDELAEFVKQDFDAKGLAWFRVEADGKLWSPIAKNFSGTCWPRLASGLEPPRATCCSSWPTNLGVTCKALPGLRKRLGAELKLYDPRQMHFSWVVEFPMFEWDKEENRWGAMHHPFTSPRPQDMPLLDTEPGTLPGSGLRPGDQRLRGRRRHDPDPRQRTAAEGLRPAGDRCPEGPGTVRLPAGSPAVRRPPHGGIALGIDRVVMLFGGWTTSAIASPSPRRSRPRT